MRTITIDIETIPDVRPGARDEFIRAAAENIRVPDKATKETLAADLGITDKDEIKFMPRASLDARWIAEIGPHRAEPEGDAAWRKTAFQGARGQIVCIGVAVDDEEPVSFCSDVEHTTLAGAFMFMDAAVRSVSGATRPRIVGHNVAAFDLRFLMQRSIILGVQAPAWMPFDARPWDSERVYDTMTQWAGHGNRISMDALASALGIPGKQGMDGSMVYDAWAAGRIDEIAEYCREDVRITRNIYRRMTFQPIPELVSTEF